MSSSKNINSFADNMAKTITSQTNTLNLLSSLQLSLTTNDTFVTYDYTNVNGETNTYELPSYNALINRIKALEESMHSLSIGKGSINLEDGSRRTIKLLNIPETPNLISTVADPTQFNVDTNWFFEDLMFPGATVAIDLTGQIPDDSDRVKVARIILDSGDGQVQQLWANNLALNLYDYVSLKALLTYNGIVYSEDIQTIELPLVSNSAAGIFLIIDDPEIINGNTWYKLNTIYYNTLAKDGITNITNNVLSIGDTLAYSNTLFTVLEIDLNTYKVRLKVLNGSAIPGIYSTFRFYLDPFREKKINIRFGAHEYDFIYIKAVNELYNLLADEWSVPIKFDTDNLTYANDANMTFLQYYQRNIVDWGANFIADAKQKMIKAYYGSIPNAPVLNASDLRVVQINTQINASIDTAEVKNTASEIETTKSLISSLKSTIAAQKSALQDKNIDISEYNSLQLQISTNTTDLKNLEASYSTLVTGLKSIVKENQAVNIDPKYHVRGFFPIPDFKYQDIEETIPEEIIGFEVAYRYICTDNTGVQLNTFTYLDPTSSSMVTGTFTDWSVIASKLKLRVYNNETGLYEWSTENVADGTEININQIDIPITKGEKVEIKVRSISEAGYPDNALRSEWSNSVIVSFPDTLSTTNEIADLIAEINDDAIEITINNTLDAIGVGSHMDDSIANTNSVNGLYYKHESKNIAYENETEYGIESISVLTKIDDMEARIKMLETTIKQLKEVIQSSQQI